MVNLTICVDESTLNGIRRLGEKEGREPADMAARLLKRAVLRARPRPVYDVEAIKAAYAEFAEEDMALAESDSEETVRLLAEEDAA